MAERDDECGGGTAKTPDAVEAFSLLYSMRCARSRTASRVTAKVQHFFAAPAAERPAPCGAGLPAVIEVEQLGERPTLAGAEGQPGQPEEADAQRGELRRLGRGGGRGRDQEDGAAQRRGDAVAEGLLDPADDAGEGAGAAQEAGLAEV